MERVDSFNCMENLVERYVFIIKYYKPTMKKRMLRFMSVESTPFMYRECCSGCMQQTISELTARGFLIQNYYIEKIIVSDNVPEF